MSVLAVAPAAAADALWELDGAVNLNYTRQTGAADTTDRVFTDVRPGIIYQTLSETVSWRLGYVFSGLIGLQGEGGSSYSNHAEVAMVSQLGRRTGMTLTLGFTQGGTSFLQSQPAAEAGQPQIRNTANPDLVNSNFAEALSHEITASLRLSQGLAAFFSTPQDDFSEYNLTLNGVLGLEHLFPRDGVGLDLRPSFSYLHPLDTPGLGGYVSLTNTLLAHWNHDFSRRWNAIGSVGIQQVVTFSGSYPLAILPTGSLSASYVFGEKVTGAAYYGYAAQTDIQTGTVAATNTVSVRGAYSFGKVLPRVFAASAGYLHASPIGQASALVASGSGSAVQLDAQLSWSLSDTLVATGRYSLAYQFDQGNGIEPSIAQVLLIGLTGRYSNERVAPRFPGLGGQRVDGTDAPGFPDSETRRR